MDTIEYPARTAQAELTREELKAKVGHHHEWAQALAGEEDEILLFCECGAMMDEDGMILI